MVFGMRGLELPRGEENPGESRGLCVQVTLK